MAEASAPASSANLGPGFDCLALALEIRCRVKAEPADVWSVDHTGPQQPPAGAHDAVLIAARRAVGEEIPMELCVHNDVPMGRGLGSSSAAYAAGALAALRAAGHEPSPLRLYEIVTELEGHADNAAAAVYGGLMLATQGEPQRLPWNPVWRLVVAVPDDHFSTSEARRMLPTTYALDVVVRTTARMGALIGGLLAGDADLLRAAGGDEIHEGPRRLARPDVADLIQTARRAGAAHAAWSGAGPSVVAIVDTDRATEVAGALERRLEGAGRVLTPEVATLGAV